MEEKPRRRPVVAKGRGHGDVSYSEAHVDRALRRTMKDLRRAEAAKKKRAEIILPEFISVSNLAQALGVPLDKFVNKMLELGFEDVNHDQVLTGEDAGLVAQEYGFNPQQTKDEDEKDLFPAPNPEDKSSWPQRPPVVTIMGHVDHGKTTLLDYLRKSSIAANEHGGITQHIGAFSVPLSSSGKTITFLDTPGHAAFLTMRERGANVTDIVILVVAADDSIMPQTLEAIKHAHAAKVPIIVAINKVDKEDANPRRVKQDLAVNGIEIEDFGGDTQAILVSGKTGQGMDELEEATVTLSEMLDNRADPDGKAEGWVLESSKKRDGLMATVLVRRGTLRPGDIIVAGKTWARVRRLMNEAGKPMKSVGPGMPAEIDGWRAQPEAGDEVLQAEDEQHAARVVDFRQAKADRQRMAKDMEAINEARKLVQERRKREKETADGKAKDQDRASEDAEKMGENTALTGPKTIPFIVKADVSGSVEAVVNVISGIGNAEVRPIIVRSAVGPVTETDLDFAAVAHGHIISFNTRVDPKFMVEAKRLGVDIFDQNIIYRVTEDIRAKLSEFLPPLVVQKVTGEAEIAQIFPINMKRNKQLFIAGCKVKNGVMTRNSKVKVLRNKDVIYQGSLSSLKNVKKDTTEMRKGTECGIGFDNWEDFKVGDQIQCYDESLEKRYL
ncbi:initiation factor 2 [Eremomyces bilateralis CBS 781.70]|uniref:Translation initiation factor IF-2, mitochondrial n=1 Tax=Eremomyces bilateralis CBS 781.70 TaxID=1392243 RepID=A0A6G1FTB8_9PEZI|nr:initiation factor 2 [Eremomyces bilateralis CBS 781.70]KAF1808919.1 initiation factor 2 [Eremomyces bilateralis CBS 781.70]